MPRRPALKAVAPEVLNTRQTSSGDELSSLVDSPGSSGSAGSCTSSSEKASEAGVDTGEELRRADSLSPPPRPAAPARISSKEPTPESEDELVELSRPILDIPSSQAAQTLHMTFNHPTGHQGSFEVKMDSASLLGLGTPGGPSSFQPPHQQYALAPDSNQQQRVKNAQIIMQSPRYGFHSLPPELRNRIYRMLFVSPIKIELHAGHDLSLAAQFLRCQRQVHQEGAGILYGLNQFRFSRSDYRVGRWFDSYIAQTAYTHVEECLRAIGHHNISLMRDVTFAFSDAHKPSTGDLSPYQRRFANDRSLQRSLKRLGKYGQLQTLTLEFRGKRMVTRGDQAFLQALTTIMAKEVHIVGNLDPKIRSEVLDCLVFPGHTKPLWPRIPKIREKWSGQWYP